MRCWNVPLSTTQNTGYMCSNWGKSNNCGFTVYGKKLTRNTKCINQKDIPTHFKVYQTFHQRLFHLFINENYKQRRQSKVFSFWKMVLVLFLHLTSIVFPFWGNSELKFVKVTEGGASAVSQGLFIRTTQTERRACWANRAQTSG